ncbi:MAG: hypothetical protein R3310_02870 [Candidatus Competibacteraceae bacterium]|nr:hypothetical protein [Candidatus Competibacteraceae bacterium]
MTEQQEQTGSLITSLSALGRTLLGLMTDALQLLAAEARLAGLSLAAMVAAGIALAAVGTGSWLAVVAALAVWLVRLGLAWEVALLLVAVLNLAMALILLKTMAVLSRNLTFRATRRHLLPGGPVPDRTEPHADSRDQASAPPGGGSG